MYRFVFVLAFAGACTNEASHLPNPLLLPVYAVGSGGGNALYGARRRQVSDFVNANTAPLLGDIRQGGGPVLSRAMELARIRAQRRQEFIQQARRDLAMFAADSETLVVALMVHGD